MTTQRGSRNEFRAIRGLLADAALDRALIGLGRLDLALKNWETQPRAPAGQSDGGRWVTGPGGVPLKLPPTSWSSLRDGQTGADQAQQAQTESTTLEDGSRVLSIRVRNRRGQLNEQHAVIAPDGESRIFENDGLTQTIRDGISGYIISRATFTPSEIQVDRTIQPILFNPEVIRKAAHATFELALSVLAALSGRKGGFGTVLGLTAHEFRPDSGSENGTLEWVGKLDQQTLDATCPRNGLVLALANSAAQSVSASRQYSDATDFGNKVHNKINRDMKDKYQNEDFTSELSLVPNALVNSKNKIRVRRDIFEHIRSTETVCVYNHKTGLEQLSFGRAMELVGAAVNLYPFLKRIIMIQVKTDPC